MNRKRCCVWMGMLLLTISAAAQTTVTTSGGTTNSVPVFTGTSTLGNSPITVSGSNVGIGTTSPSDPLTIVGTNNPEQLRIQSTSSGGHSWGIASWGTYSGFNSGGLGFGDYTAGSWRMYIDGSGNVGIGTTSPSAKLEVDGNIKLTSGSGASITFPDGTVQSTAYSQQGTFQVGNGSINAVQALYVDSNLNGNTVSAPSQGVWIEWNNANGMTDFVNNEGGGSGGWQFINTTLAGTPIATPMTIQGSGDVGIGTASPTAKLEVDGNIKLTSGSGGSITFPDGTVQSTAYTGVACGGDYAEQVNVTGDRRHFEPGDVLVVDPDHPGQFLKSATPYSTAVAGVYSTKPGFVGHAVGMPKTQNQVPMAMLGIVPTKVTAENGPIHPGDLLVTSSQIGYAMRGTDRSRLTGAVIGKALGNLSSGTGKIEVLVTLQ